MKCCDYVNVGDLISFLYINKIQYQALVLHVENFSGHELFWTYDSADESVRWFYVKNMIGVRVLNAFNNCVS